MLDPHRRPILVLGGRIVRPLFVPPRVVAALGFAPATGSISVDAPEAVPHDGPWGRDTSIVAHRARCTIRVITAAWWIGEWRVAEAGDAITWSWRPPRHVVLTAPGATLVSWEPARVRVVKGLRVPLLDA